MKLKKRDPHDPEVVAEAIEMVRQMTPEEALAFLTYRTPGIEETDMTGMLAESRSQRETDGLAHYRALIKQILQRQADLMSSQPVPGEEVDCVFDEQRDHYLLLKYGCSHGKYVHDTRLHVRIVDNKIRIEADMTEEGLGDELLEAGIPKEDIVLAFNPPGAR